ncbi:hypothetical protein G6L37_00765 [Agrobacterium rubi]|nr:hypothetical protein [Agrobacterium rubi]NTF23922.1 hypothetical protein [Agrobacterium rubi]
MTMLEMNPTRQLVEDLVGVGFFRLSGIETEMSLSQMLEIAETAAEGHLRAVGDGWYLTNWEETLASNVFNRIAGVAYQAVPFRDVSEALMKAVSYGPASMNPDARRASAKSWISAYESMPPRSIIENVADIVGARIKSVGGVEQVDFSDVLYPIEPSQIEMDVIHALEESPFGAMQLSRLCRRIGKSRASTYHHVDKMPFILKDTKKAARMIGAEGHPEDFVSDAEFFRNFVMTQDGVRAKIEMSANEECIESNSCNIPYECRRLIEGEYTDVNTGVAIRISTPSGPERRKVSGLSKIIRGHFKGYASKDTVSLVLDKATRLARVDVMSMHASDKMAAVEDMFLSGIRPGALSSCSAHA